MSTEKRAKGRPLLRERESKEGKGREEIAIGRKAKEGVQVTGHIAARLRHGTARRARVPGRRGCSRS